MTEFHPFLVENFKNATSMRVNLTSPELLGNQSNYITFRIYSNVTAISMKITIYGNNGFLTILGPYALIQFSYAFGGILLLVGGLFSLSMYDVDLSFAKPRVARFRGGGKR